MLMRRVSAKDRIPNGVVRAALVAGVASGVVAASLSGIGTASGTCIGISGINIPLGGGGGCNSTFGNFALGLGAGTVADASGGFLNGAIAVGTNVAAFAEGSGFSVANVALNLGAADDPIDPATGVPTGPAFSRVTAGPGFLNLGANFLGNATNSDPPFAMDIKASGVASSALNFIGNRNRLTSSGVLANSTVVGNFFGFPNGSDNDVTSTGPVSVAFVRQGLFTDNSAGCPSICGNIVNSGPFSIAGAFNTVHRTVNSGGATVSSTLRSRSMPPAPPPVPSPRPRRSPAAVPTGLAAASRAGH